MDTVEFSVIEDATQIVVPQEIPLNRDAASLCLCVAAEDPDKINLCHVLEGMLFCRGWQAMDSIAIDQAKRVLLEGFDNAWKYEENVERALKQVRLCQIGIGKIQTNHHQCHQPIELTLRSVKQKSSNSLMVSTVYQPWEVGLLIACTRLIKSN